MSCSPFRASRVSPLVGSQIECLGLYELALKAQVAEHLFIESTRHRSSHGLQYGNAILPSRTMIRKH